MAFQMKTKEMEGMLVVELSGSLDTTAADDLKTAFGEVKRAGRKRVILSLKGLKYIASSAIRELLSLGKWASQSQGALKIAEVPPNVMDIFRMVGLGNAVPILGPLSDAIDSFGPQE